MKSQKQKNQQYHQNRKINQHNRIKFDVDKETFYNLTLPVLCEMLQKDAVLYRKSSVRTSQHETNTRRRSQTFQEFLRNDAYEAFLLRETLRNLIRG